MLDYGKMNVAELRRITNLNPVDSPHYRRAYHALALKYQGRSTVSAITKDLLDLIVKLLFR